MGSHSVRGDLMEILHQVINATIQILNTYISFGNIRFSLLTVSLALGVLSVVVFFIKKIFE